MHPYNAPTSELIAPPDHPVLALPSPYAANSLAARIAQLPKSAYIAYLATLSAGSLPIVRSTLGRISQLLYRQSPESAPWHLMTANQFHFMVRHYELCGLAPKTLHRHVCLVRSVLKQAFFLRMIPDSHVAEYETILHRRDVVKGAQGRGVIAPHRSLTDDEI
ncbi:MAG: hypothetical protein ACRCYV_05755, partial [Aeromonas sp.]